MKAVFKFFFVLFVLLSATILLLSRMEVRLPQEMLDNISSACSSSNFVLRIDSICLKLPSRLRMNGVRFTDISKADAKPFASASRIDVHLSFVRFPWRIESIVKSVVVTGLKMPRLPDGYYIPDSIEFPGSYDFTETNEPVELDIPDFAPFKLTLLEPDVLDLKAKRVTVKSVAAAGNVMRLDGIKVEFPDRDPPMEVTGDCELDIPSQRIRGSVHGQARQPNIRPMLQALDITNCYQFVDAFTGVTTPVDAGCRFDVNLRNSDLRLFLDLHPTGGAYRGVPLESAQGNVDVRVFVRGHCQNAHITVGPVDARIADGTSMTGTVFYENTNDIGYVTFRKIISTTSLSNALAVADVLNDGTLDCLQPETPPTINLDGTLAVDPAHAATNNLNGSIEFAKGRFFGIPLVDAKSNFHLRGDMVSFCDAHASLPRGGSISGAGLISFPGFDSNRATFRIAVKGSGISLTDAADILGVEAGDRKGKISGSVEFDAPLTTALVSRVNGKVSLRVENGQLARFNLFAGLTDYLAKNVPGVSSLVDQSNAEMECVISNGVMHASKVNISGDIFSITGSGTYSMPDDNLNFTARVRIFKNDSIIGKLTNPITWTFSKLLLEFRVYGSIDNPKWKYISVIERLL